MRLLEVYSTVVNHPHNPIFVGFSRIGSRGYFFFLIFQCFINRVFKFLTFPQVTTQYLLITCTIPFYSGARWHERRTRDPLQQVSHHRTARTVHSIPFSLLPFISRANKLDTHARLSVRSPLLSTCPCFRWLTGRGRAERKLSQVCSETEYRKVFQRLQTLPAHVEHLVVQLGASSLYEILQTIELKLV